MKKAEKRRVLVSSTWELRTVNGLLVASWPCDEGRDYGGHVASDDRLVRVARYRLERPEVVELPLLGTMYETEYRLDDGRAVATVWGEPGSPELWEVWAENHSGMLKLKERFGSRADAEECARKLLRKAGYKVFRRSK